VADESRLREQSAGQEDDVIRTTVADTGKFVAEVIREAIECDRTECRPEQHTRFVEENLSIAAEYISTGQQG
jgi:hypothetical protein